MSRYSEYYTLRDPRNELTAIGALANAGRPMSYDEPTRAAGLAALARAGRSPEEQERERLASLAAIMSTKPTEAAPTEEELEAQRAIEGRAYGALAKPAQDAEAARPDADAVAREIESSAAGALAKTLRDAEATKPSPEAEREREDGAFGGLAEAGRARDAARPDPTEILVVKGNAAGALANKSREDEAAKPSAAEVLGRIESAAGALSKTGDEIEAARPSPDIARARESSALGALRDDGEAKAAKQAGPDALRAGESSAFGALAKAGYDLTPPAPELTAEDDAAAEKARVAKGASALDKKGRDQAAEAPDPALEQEVKGNAAGALANVARDAAANKPDPSVEEGVKSSAAAALTKKGKDDAPEPLPLKKEPPTPIGLRKGSDSEDTARAQLDEQLKLSPDEGSGPTTVERKPGEVTVTKEAPGKLEQTTVKSGSDLIDKAEQAARSMAMAGGSVLGGGDVLGVRPGAGVSDLGDSEAPGVSGWALAADIILNKGRGLGGIIGQAEQQKQLWKADQAKRALAQRAGREHEQNYAVAMRNADLREREGKAAAETAEARRDRELHPERYPLSPEQQLGRDRLKADTDRTKALDDAATKREEFDQWQAKDTSERGWQTSADNDAERTAAQQRAADERQYQHGQDAAQAARLENETKTKAASTLAAQADQYNKETKFDVGAASQIDALKEVVSKYAQKDKDGNAVLDKNGKPTYSSIPGIGAIESRVPDTILGMPVRNTLASGGFIGDADDARLVENSKNTLAELAQRKESGAAGSEAEKYRYLIRTGAKPGASQEQFLVALDAAEKLTRMSLNTFATGKEAAAQAALGRAKLGHWFDQPEPTNGSAKTVGAREVTPVPDGETKPPDEPKTGGGVTSTASDKPAAAYDANKTIDDMRTLKPETPATAQAVIPPFDPSRKYTLTSPDGETEVLTLGDESLYNQTVNKIRRKKGWSLQ